MAKTPPHIPGGFYHVAISLDGLNDPLAAEDGVTIRPISAIEAVDLAKRFQKIGRNQLCLCGSGLKFKRCCLRKAH